jgi:hypothetical protein
MDDRVESSTKVISTLALCLHILFFASMLLFYGLLAFRRPGSGWDILCCATIAFIPLAFWLAAICVRQRIPSRWAVSLLRMGIVLTLVTAPLHCFCLGGMARDFIYSWVYTSHGERYEKDLTETILSSFGSYLILLCVPYVVVLIILCASSLRKIRRFQARHQTGSTVAEG